MRRFALALTSLLFLQPSFAMAALFPDIPEGSLYQDAVEALAEQGVVKGNPDGKFHPERSVNRAEMLKMLYMAAGRTPNATISACFTDIVKGSWYESYVCDAASKEHGFVKGYPDGSFHPGSPVNRVEALKMIYSVMGLPLSVRAGTKVRFNDVSADAWYNLYVDTALDDGILPLPGQGTSRLYPDQALLRGEAAFLLHHAMIALHGQEVPQPESSSSSSSSVSSTSSSSSSGARNISVTFPFTDSGKFEKKGTVSYSFSLQSPKTVLAIDVQSTGFVQATITCRLFLIGEDGFSGEYYLGIQDNGVCRILTAARPGNYQLQIQPDKADAYFSVNVKTATGDGNDGFLEAQVLPNTLVKTGVLGAQDIYDWYTITIDSQRKATVEVISASKVGCTIYTPLNIDQFGFEGPQCNVEYQFNAGTYYVGISHGDPVSKSQTYTIKLR
jgi:hypothetical protein